MAEAESTELPIGAVEGQPGVTVIDQDNFEAYVEQQLGPKPEIVEPIVNEDPEVAAKKAFDELTAKQAEAAAPKEGDMEGSKVFHKGKWVGKNDFNYRLHVKEQATEKVAQEKIEAAAAETKKFKDDAEALAKERDALKAKYEPPPSNERKEKPTPGQYGSVDEYSKALINWAKEDARIEGEEKRAQEAQVKERADIVTKWNERATAVQAEIPDYVETINASDVKLSDQATEAVLRAENGHKILYHFAKNPDAAAALGKLTVRDMLLEVGRLNGSLGSQAKPKEEKAAPVVEISRAPAPVVPLKTPNASSGLKVDAQGNWIGTFEEFKAADRAGKFDR